jgi:hypothetical protein
MGAGILSQVPVINESHAKHFTLQDNNNAGLVGSARARGVIPHIRMCLLHFENTFGESHSSEYCLDAMLSLVLLIARSAKPDTDRLARLTGAMRDPCPAKDGLAPDHALGCQAASVRRAG